MQRNLGLYKFLSYAPVYDFVQAIFGAKRGRECLLRDYIKPQSGMAILDIGCGTAEILKYLPNDIIYYGVEPEKKYISAMPADTRGIFLCNDIDSMPSIDIKFDIVLALGVVHHLDDAQADKLFSFARRALKKTGRLITIDGVFTSKQNPIAKILLRMDRGKFVRNEAGYVRLAQNHFGMVQATVKSKTFPPYTHCILQCTP